MIKHETWFVSDESKNYSFILNKHNCQYVNNRNRRQDTDETPYHHHSNNKKNSRSGWLELPLLFSSLLWVLLTTTFPVFKVRRTHPGAPGLLWEGQCLHQTNHQSWQASQEMETKQRHATEWNQQHNYFEHSPTTPCNKDPTLDKRPKPSQAVRVKPFKNVSKYITEKFTRGPTD